MSRFPIAGDVRVARWVRTALWGLCAIVVLPAAAQPSLASLPSVVPPDSADVALNSFLDPGARKGRPEASASDSTLRLSELLRAAATANPSLQAARLRAESRRSEPAQARALPDPVVGATVFPYSVVTARGAQRSQWRAQQSIPFPGTRALRGTVAELRADAAQADADALAQTLALQIRRAYYTLYRVQEERRVIRRFQSDLRQFEDVALAQYEVGTEGQPAVLKAQIERQRLDVQVETLLAERRSALQRLARLTGRASLADDSVRVAAPAEASATRVDRPLDRRPEATALQAEIDRATQSIALARKETWPDLTIGVQYVDIAERDLTPTMNGRDALAVSLGVQVPLWRGKQKAQIEEARVERRRAQAELDAFELEVRTQIDDLRSQIDRQRSQLRLLQDRLLPKAETALDATLSAYQTGTTDFLDLLDAQRTLFQLRLQRIGVYTRLLHTTADLERAAGRATLPSPDASSTTQ
jgi:outer membrane protein TolC